MESKFKIGDTVFFMEYSAPVKAEVKGISFVVGEFQESVHTKRVGTIEKPSIMYSFGTYTTVDEIKLFSSKEDLQESLFGNL